MTEQREGAQEYVYTEEEVQRRLEAELPHWYLEGGWIKRKYRTQSWKGTLMVIGAVGHLAEAAFHHPDLEASYAFVIVKLATHRVKGVTDSDFDLAKKMEEFIQWQPAKDPDTPLSGTPDDGRFRYLKYDN